MTERTDDAPATPEFGRRAASDGLQATTAGRLGLRLPAGLSERLGELRSLSLLGVLVLLAIAGVATSGGRFLSASNIFNILVSSSIIGVVVVGMTFVIIGGGIDLSVGGLVALSSVWATTLASQQFGPWAMVACALLVGMGAGLLNGLLISLGRLVPFIVTLAMMVASRGLAEAMSGKKTQLVTVDAINNIATSDVFGIPFLVIIFAAVVLAGWILLNRTTFGRRTFAVGGNTEAARLAGINVSRHTVLLYVLSGLCCGIAAIMLVSLTTTGSSTHGDLYELDAIAAVIIGGTLLTGGKGTLVGSVLGALVFTTLTNIFVLNNLAIEVQNIAQGLIIIAAVLLQRRGTT